MLKYLIYPATASIISVPILSYTVFVKVYKKYKTRYDFDDNEIPIRKDIQERLQEVTNDLNIKELYREHIKFFNVYDISMYHAGTTLMKCDGIIGIPVNFEYKSVEDITEDTISFRSIQVDWNTETIKQFRNSLVLSENAQKFAIARELLTVTGLKPLYNGYNYMLNILLAYLISNVFLKKLIKNKSRWYLFAGAIVIVSPSILLHYCIINYVEELRINEILTELGDKYIEGGVEYYEQLLQRNKALKALFGSMSKYRIAPSGDEIFRFISGKINYTEQLDYFKSKMKNP